MSFGQNLKALQKRHVALGWNEHELLQEEPLQWELPSTLPTSDVLIFWGVPIEVDRVRHWLDEVPQRRLICVFESLGNVRAFLAMEDAVILIADCRIHWSLIETPLQISCIAKEVAWRSALRQWTLLLLAPGGDLFREQVEECHTAAELLLADAADWGCGVYQNIKANRAPAKNGLELLHAFQGIPAIVCGAGPSLEKNGPVFKEVQDRALILAGGQAIPLLHSLGVEPHFAGAIDPNTPSLFFKEALFWQTPSLFQRRMHRDNFSMLHGDKVLFPDSHFLFEAYLSGFDHLFEGGWTVGTFLLRCAFLMGCDPIIWAGMDLTWSGGKKYALQPEGPTAVEQKDFWMAARWMEEMARAHPERRWINATEGGVVFSAPIETMSLEEALVLLPRPRDLVGKVHQVLQGISEAPASMERFEAWPQTLQASNETVQRVLLEPFWNLYRPLLEREVDVDLLPFSKEQKMSLHRTLLFQTILQEHVCCNAMN